MRQSMWSAFLGPVLALMHLVSGCSFEKSDDAAGAGDWVWEDRDTDEPDDDNVEGGVYARLEPTGPVLGDTFGLASQMKGDADQEWKRRFEASTLAQMGVGLIRVGFSWEYVEPENDVWDWTLTDQLNETAQEHGLSWNARLAYVTDWAAPGGSPSEVSPDDFADYAGRLASRYCGDIERYEVWNEPNLYHFWAPDPDPEHYGRLLKAAYVAVKSACPDAEVLYGGLSSNNFPHDWFFNTYPFFDQVLSAHPDICDYFDAIPIHPYTILQMARPERAVKVLGFDAPDLPGQVDDIRARLLRAGCVDKPVLFTEFGYPSTYLGDEMQAEFLVRTVLLGTTREVAGYYLYTFWDKTGREPPTENDFGLFEYPGEIEGDQPEAKASFYAYRALVERLSSTRYAGDLSKGLGLPDGVFGLAFTDVIAPRLVLAVWDSRDDAGDYGVELPLPPSILAARIVEMDGTDQHLDLENDLVIKTSSGVRYIEFELSQTWW